MKRTILFKAAALVVMISICLTLTTGCSQNEIRLFAALMNPNQPYSYESAGSVEFSLDIVQKKQSKPSYYDDESDSRLMGAILSGAGFAYSEKMSADKDYNKIKSEMLITPIMFGGRLNDLTLGMWTDIDGQDMDNSNLYVKMPRLLSAMTKETAGKDYLTLNLGGLYDLLDEALGGAVTNRMYMENLVKNSVDIMKPISDVIFKAASQMKPDEVYVSGVRPISDENGQRGYVYTLNITDGGMKKLLRSIVNDIKMETVKEFVYAALDSAVEYIGLMPENEIYDYLVEELADTKKELDSIGFETAYNEMIEEMNEFLDTLDKVRILGPKGITFDIEVDNKGFVTAWDGILDFSIDVAAYEKHFNGYNYNDISKINFTVKCNHRITRINKVVYVEMPAITDKNSVSLESIVEGLISDVPDYPLEDLNWDDYDYIYTDYIY